MKGHLSYSFGDTRQLSQFVHVLWNDYGMMVIKYMELLNGSQRFNEKICLDISRFVTI